MNLNEISDKYNLYFDDEEQKFEPIIIKLYNSSELILKDYDLTNPMIINLIGEYYYSVHKDYDRMMKYLLMAIKKDNSYAMINLGYYYKVMKDYDQMLKYYLMAIEKCNSRAMIHLGYYYREIKDYELMIKYYLLAIEKGDAHAMERLGTYYKKMKDYEQMMKYYLMAIEKNNSYAMYFLSKYYWYYEKNYKSAKEYYIMAIEKNNINAKMDNILYDFIYKYFNNIKECIVCYDTKINIKYNCGHDICFECYTKHNICYYRC